jgi:hypothetical protein
MWFIAESSVKHERKQKPHIVKGVGGWLLLTYYHNQQYQKRRVGYLWKCDTELFHEDLIDVSQRETFDRH